MKSSISSEPDNTLYVPSEKRTSLFLQSIPPKLMEKVSCCECRAVVRSLLCHTKPGNACIRPFLLSSFFMQQTVQTGEDHQLSIFKHGVAFSCNRRSCHDQEQGKAYLPRCAVSTGQMTLLLSLFYFLKSH